MRRHRFIGTFDLDRKSLAISDEALVHQWRSVLRLTPGDILVLVDERSSREAEARLIGFDRNRAEVELLEAKAVETESVREVTLYCAILKRENFELVVQKATECGVARIVPLVTERTVKQGLRYDRLEKIAREAAEQASRGRVPTIHEAVTFAEAVKSIEAEGGEQYFFHTGEEKRSTFSPMGEKVDLFIGPEGGWSESEVEQASRAGFSLQSLGPRTLRGETAAVVTVFLATQ